MNRHGHLQSQRTSPPRRARRGAALLLTMGIVAIVSLLVVVILDTVTTQYTAVRNTADYERALYLAGAGVHHALAMLEEDGGWRATVTEGAYPADDSYSAAAVNGSGGAVVVTSTGVAGAVTRSLQVTVTAE